MTTYDYKPSPNHSSRNGAAIKMIVLHATASGYASALAWLRNPQPDHPDDRVSTHYLIRKDGHIAQLVVDDMAAWHAGRSSWRGRNSQQIQECSLGVELENANDGRDPYPAAQLNAARDLCKSLIAAYHIARVDLVRHLDIATPKGRKTDPAGFPWESFVASCYPPAPAPPVDLARYRVVDIQISQKQSGGPPYAGTLAAGALVEIDIIYPNQMCHLRDGRGFVPISALEPAGHL